MQNAANPRPQDGTHDTILVHSEMTWTTWLYSLPHYTFQFKPFDVSPENVVQNWKLYEQTLALLAILYLVWFVLIFLCSLIVSAAIEKCSLQYDKEDTADVSASGLTKSDLNFRLRMRFDKRVTIALGLSIICMSALCVSTFTNSEQVSRNVQIIYNELNAIENYRIDLDHQTGFAQSDLNISILICSDLANSTMSSQTREYSGQIQETLQYVWNNNSQFLELLSNVTAHRRIAGLMTADITRHYITLSIFLLFGLSFSQMLWRMFHRQSSQPNKRMSRRWMALYFFGLWAGVFLTAAEFALGAMIADLCLDIPGYVDAAVALYTTDSTMAVIEYYFHCGDGTHLDNPLTQLLHNSQLSLDLVVDGVNLQDILSECAGFPEYNSQCDDLNSRLAAASETIHHVMLKLQCKVPFENVRKFCGSKIDACSFHT